MMQEMKLKKHLLDFEKSMRFVYNNLHDVNALSIAILNQIDFKNGTFYTLLPDDADFERIYDFEGGEIIPQTEEPSVIHNEGLGEFLGVSVISIRKDVAILIKKILSDSKDYLALFDNFTSIPTDVHVYIEKTRLLLNGEEVYYLVDAHNTENEILAAIRTSNALWHSLGVVFKNTNILQDNLTTKDFETICKNLKYSMVMAYDREGFVFWEPLQDTNEN